MKHQQLHQAVGWFEDFVANYPRRPEGHYFLALNLGRTGLYRRAIRSAQRSAEISPLWDKPHIVIAYAWELQGRDLQAHWEQLLLAKW